MSILVSCQCGKRFKTADSSAGKRAKCPGCGQPLSIPQSEPAGDIFSLAEDEIFQPAAVPAAPVATTQKSKAVSRAAAVPPQSKSSRGNNASIQAPRISVSPGIIVTIILAILIPAAIFWAKNGPMKAHADWARISPVAESNIVGQITRAIENRYSQFGFDMRDTKIKHQATGCFFDEPVMMLSLPESVHVQGNSTEGKFRGEFHPRTWRFEIDIDILDKPHHITGNASETDQSLELDGKSIN